MKLIRTKIVERIRCDDGATRLQPIDDEEMRWKLLKEKLLEEAIEVNGAKLFIEELRELGDVLDVIEAIGEFLKPYEATIQAEREAKRVANGDICFIALKDKQP